MASIIIYSEYFLCPTIFFERNLLFRSYLGKATVISHFHGICKGNIENFINLNSCTAIFSQQLINIATVHLIIRKVAPLIPKTLAFTRKNLCVKLVFSVILYLG